MEKCLKLIVQYQGYGQSRLAQYEELRVMKDMNEEGEHRRVLVRNKHSGKQYEKKELNPSMPDILLDDAIREKAVLYECKDI